MMKHILLAALLLAPNLIAAPTTNPADVYRQAFTQLNQAKDWSDLVDDIDQTPLDAKTAQFLKKNEPVMKLLREAATMPPADWGNAGGDIDQGAQATQQRAVRRADDGASSAV